MRRNLSSYAFLAFALLLAACASLLGIKPSGGPHPFEHRAHVLKGIACTACHKGVMGAGDTGPLHMPEVASCTKCHEKPHNPNNCYACHSSPQLASRATLSREHLRFEHKKHVAASNGACVRCHSKVGDTDGESMLPSMASCFGCHQHENQFSLRVCEGCHVDLPKEAVRPESHVVHDGDFIREHGVRAAAARDLCATCHSERSCAACHGVTAPGLPARLSFDRSLETGLHRAGFRSRHAEEARAQPGLCITCHSEGACRECHTRENVAAGVAGRNPHPRGWLLPGKGGGEHGLAARGDPASCASCHGGGGEQLCIGCHKVGGPGGNPHGPGFSSAKDKRLDVPCRQCHGI